ncbi:MAG: hypothetical protein IPP72_17945 [Chitinophagaceae bacterium]|nr:hypothetical protein [Chitinophagaceae bacterium]
MKQKIFVLLAMCISSICFGQMKYDWGEKFDFSDKQESKPQLVMLDNYNTYLLTVTEIDGLLSSHKVTIRKFDQKNQLIDTYTQEFQKIDASTLYNYLGFKEVGNNQVVVFAESYSGKEKKKDIYKYVFDKSTGKFTTSLVVSFSIESAMKSGSTELEVSENGRYIGIINKRDPSKKEPVQDNVIMMDANTLSVLWNKEVPLEEKVYDRAFTVTNSGKAVLLRAAKGFKLFNYLKVVTQDAQEDKQFEEAVVLHNPKAISIGQADYIVDFNYDAKGLRKGDYEKIMLYDISTGKTIKNNTITDFNNIKDISEIHFTKIFLQNNEIHLFTEAKVKAGTRQVKVNAFSTMTMDEPYYQFGPSHLIIMNFEGEVKEIKNLRTGENSLADFYHSYGLLNINGRYFVNINTGGGYPGIYEQSSAPLDKTPALLLPLIQGLNEDRYKDQSTKYISQLFGYVKDARKVILCRVYYDNKMALVSLVGFPQDK